MSLFNPPSGECSSLASYGARPNDPTYNSFNALRQALSELAQAGGGTLSIPAGDYYLNFNGMADDVDPKDPRNRDTLKQDPLDKKKLILVPPGVTIAGTRDAEGNSTSRIHWKTTSFPLISFVNADHSGIVDIVFVFDGMQPQFFPWAEEIFLEAVGYRTRWIGGPYELSTVIYTIGSSNLRFENLLFCSSKSPADNEHTFGFGIVSKGKTPVPQPVPGLLASLAIGSKTPGGGLAECVSNNVYRSLRFEDYVMGILASGQCDPVFENIAGDNRGSWYRSFDPTNEKGQTISHIGPPGHLLYLSFQDAYDVQRTSDSTYGRQVFKSTTRNKNVLLRNITEGAGTLANINSLGTLALKNIDGGMVANVTSKHPAGLIQTMIDAHGLTLQDLTWSSDRDICADKTASACGVPIIGLAPGPAGSSEESSDNIRFDRVRLQTVGAITAFRVAAESPAIPLSQNILVDGLTIHSQPLLSGKGTIILRSAATHLENVTYIPLTPEGISSSTQAYAVQILSRSSDTTVNLKIQRGPGLRNDNLYRLFIEDGNRNGALTGKKCAIDRAFID
jgi:hypothetical protein